MAGGPSPITGARELERVELAPEAKASISDRLWALIVFDQILREETGKYIDFIVQVRLPAP